MDKNFEVNFKMEKKLKENKFQLMEANIKENLKIIQLKDLEH